jgi:type II secretory pathway component PulJ
MNKQVALPMGVTKMEPPSVLRAFGNTPGRSAAGSTLMELMLVLLIFGTLTAIAAALVLQTYRSVQGQLSATTLYDTSSTALMQMSREIRMAGYPPAKAFSAIAVSSHPGIVATPYLTLTNYKLVMEAAIYGNGLVQQIQYENLTGTTILQRTVTQINPDGSTAGAATSTVFLTGVQNQVEGTPLFTWNLMPGTPPPAFPQNVQNVYINLIVQAHASGGVSPWPIVLTAACPRQNF